jgi:hypothetical protein
MTPKVIMFKKYFLIILIIFALAIVIAAGFTIFFKNKPTWVLNRADEAGANNMAKQNLVRQPAVAGSFYPGQAAELQKMVNDFFGQAVLEKPTGTPKIIIVPHAGYPYSGQVAADSFKQLEGLEIKRAIVIGPSHHFPASGLYLSGADLWQTPLGLVKISDLNRELAKNDLFQVSDQIHQPEHALEIELPFLQTILPGIEIVPIVVGQLTFQQQADFAQTLNQYLDSRTILVVSVDLSHYHPYLDAVKLDNQAIKDILEFNDQAILADEIDAPWALASVLKLAKQNGWQPKLLKYANSGDVTGDKSAVVGYSAMAFYGEIREQKSENRDQGEYSEAEKKELLQVARTTLEQYLNEGKIYQPKTDNPKFKEKRGVFVTLNKNGQLRGCIGYIEPIKPLIEAVADNAISAAIYDSRFLPVKADELKDIEIEISILTVPKPDTIENAAKNKFGVVLQKGNRGATYLPQVWEDLADPGQFFSSLCLKGGLAADCYQAENIQILSYQATVFGE